MHSLLLLTLISCRDKEAGEPIQFCDGTTQVLYDPGNETELLSYPDDWLTRPDSTSPTGHRVDLSVEKAPWVTDIGDIFQPILEDISTRSGFARLGSVVLRFSKPVILGPTDPIESLTDEGLIWLDMSVDPPERVAFTASLGEDHSQMILKPVKPLRPGAQHTFIVTNEYKATDGYCTTPSPVMKGLLRSEVESQYEEQMQRVQTVLERVDIDAGNISHLLTFTTQDDLGIFNEVAQVISENDYEWDDIPTCNGEDILYCSNSFTANDYRTNGAIEDTEAIDQWSLKVHSWFPTDIEPPYPVIIYGHGLNSSADAGSAVANIVAPLGFATFAIDALHHGQHPIANPDSALPALIFLGINLGDFTFDSRSLRGSFDQSAADRLQLIQLLRQHPDIDGDGTVDIDPDQLVYYGISLGGLMGSQLMANTDIDAGILAEGGGDLPVFSTDTTTVDSLEDVLEFLVGPPDVFDRMLPVMQTGVDSSDPAVWATHVLQNRLDDSPIPNVLFPVCVEDDTVPPATAKALAHGLGISHMTPILDAVPMLDIEEGPLQGNHHSGATAAYFQFDRISQNGEVIPSNHDNLPNSPEAKWMFRHFLETHLNGVAEIRDPYAELSTPQLDQ